MRLLEVFVLSPESAGIVRVTAPVVAEALDDITARFYSTMFSDHPELLDGQFNRGNQASGAQRRALAGSIVAFAGALLANPDVRPDGLLARIAHKHAAVGISDDQYTIVHKYLFAAIAEVLGDAITPEVAAAWDEVYWLMATGSTRPVLALHADRSPADHALRTETSELIARLPQARAVFWYEQPGVEEPGARTGQMDLTVLSLPADATAYLCGPLPFMRAVRAELLRAGIPAEKIKYEVFGPDLWLADSATPMAA